MNHQAEAKEIVANGDSYTLGYLVGLVDDLLGGAGDKCSRRFCRDRARAIVAEWCKEHPDAPTSKRLSQAVRS